MLPENYLYLVETGGKFSKENVAPTSIAFVSSAQNLKSALSDQTYGDSSKWESANTGTVSGLTFVGLSFGSRVKVRSYLDVEVNFYNL